MRVRPFFKREENNGVYLSTIDISEDKKILNLYEYHNIEIIPPEMIESYIEDENNITTHQFKFDFCF